MSRDDAVKDGIQRLRRYIADEQPGLVEWVYRFWGKQQRAVTYQQLREAIMTGALSPETLQQWQKNYASIITNKLAPQWEDAMNTAAQQIKTAYPEYNFDPGAENVKTWTAQHSAELVTNLSGQQASAINSLIHRATGIQNMTPDELARVIRPVIGLTKPQATANVNYYRSLRENKISQKEAQKKASTYADRQHRYRAQNIARTELAKAYNTGEYLGMKQAQDQNLIGEVKKKWLTADDSRVCAACASIDEMEMPMDALFPLFGGILTPPAHPSCRCCLVYEETE